MERSNFFNDQHVQSDDLNTIESTAIDSIKKHTLALVSPQGGSGSVIGQPGSNYLLPSYVGFNDQLRIAPGSALDSNGEIIFLSGTEFISKNGLDANQTWALGPAGTFYIKLQYAESSGSFKANDAGISYPTRYTDSYNVIVNNSVPVLADVCVGSFTADASGSIVGTTVNDLRTFIRAKAFDDRTYLSASPIGGHTVVKDHILAKGSGTQTTTNPHGTTLSDLGYSDASLITHWRDGHTNGIMLLARDATTLQSWSGSVVNTVNDYINFYPPSPYAVMNVAGSLFSGSIGPLLGTSAPYDGVFWVVANGTATAQFLPTGSYSFDALNPHKYPAYSRLGLATITNTGADVAYINERDMYAMSPADIKADFIESSASVPLTETSTLVDNLNRIRGQIAALVPATPTGSITYVTGFRSADVAYQNSTNHPMYVNVTISSPDMSGNSAQNWLGELRVGPTSSPVPTNGISPFSFYCINTNFGLSPVYLNGSTFAVVPPHFWYLIHLTGGATLVDVWETTSTS